MTNFSLNTALPADENDLARRIGELTQTVRQNASARSLEAASIGSGGLSISGTGGVSVVTPEGVKVMEFGAMPDSPEYNRPDGSRQMGFRLRRDTGESAFVVLETVANDGSYQQAVAMLDRSDNRIVADDTNGGKGLARPHLALNTPTDTNVNMWPSTTSAAWTGIATSYFERQNPGISWDLWCQADGSTSGQFRIKVDGAVVATSPAVTGTFSVWSATYLFPAGWTFGATSTLSVEAIRTAGTGTIRAQFLRLSGAQS